MANKIVKTEYVGPEKQILIAEDSYKVTLGAVVGNAGISADDNGRKILKAGTPVAGDFKARNTAFVKNTTAPNAIVLHDVDVTAGNENATIVMAGVVDVNKLESDVQSMISSTVEEKLTRIIFFK